MKKQLLIPLIVLSLLPWPARGDSGTWLAIPLDNNWNNPANWSSSTVPNDSVDVATFNVSGLTGISVMDYTTVGGIVFSEGADGFTITNLPSNTQGLWFAGDITNNSGMTQNITLPSDGAGNASFIVFYQSARAGDQMVFTVEANPISGSVVPAVAFQSSASAGSATFVNDGGNVTEAVGGQTNFFDFSSASDSTIINRGATVSGAIGGTSSFLVSSPTAGNATLIANAGTNGGDGGSFTFKDGSTGGTARVELFGNGYLDMSGKNGGTFSIGSTEGDGQVYLGRVNCSVGSNGLTTTFSGVLHPGHPAASALGPAR